MRFLLSCALITMWSMLTVDAEPTDAVLGIVSQPPQGVISVKVEGGYMVPYTDKIPGTDITFEMIPVPGGTFLMGSPSDELGRHVDEGPQVKVQVAPMWVGKKELTQREYAEFELLYSVFVEIASDREGEVNAGAVDSVTAPTPLYDPSMIYEYGDGLPYPAVAMTQYAAQQYTKWLSAITKRQYRLPTEAEWEYACRAGSTTRFHWGDDPGEAFKYEWSIDNTVDGFSRGGKKLPNAFGLHDMGGNVAEWTVNAYTSDGYRWLQDRPQPIKAIDTVRWPKQSNSCVVRGGMSESDLVDLRSAVRIQSDDEEWKMEDAEFPNSPWWFTTFPATCVGFRLFRSYQPLNKEEIAPFWDTTAKDVREYLKHFHEMGRGQVGILDEDLMPAVSRYKVDHRKSLQRDAERAARRRALRKRRPSPE